MHMHVDVHTDEILSEEEVDLNYEQNYVRISTPGGGGASPVVMIRDYNLVISKELHFYPLFILNFVFSTVQSIFNRKKVMFFLALFFHLI